MSDATAPDAASDRDTMTPLDCLRAELATRDVRTARVFQLDLLARRQRSARPRRVPGIGSMYPSLKAR